jgi:nitric oxide reductase large subunit
MPFLVVLIFWVSFIFLTFGLFAPRNGTVIVVLIVAALSIAASAFLIVELGTPFEGLMKISSAPLRFTLSHLGQ